MIAASTGIGLAAFISLRRVPSHAAEARRPPYLVRGFVVRHSFFGVVGSILDGFASVIHRFAGLFDGFSGAVFDLLLR